MHSMRLLRFPKSIWLPRLALSTGCAAISRTTWLNRVTLPTRCTASRSTVFMGGSAGLRRRWWMHSTYCSSTCRTLAAASIRSLRRCAMCSKRRPNTGKAVWVLDRPNPVGRPVEGFKLRPEWESFVGAGPLPLRHGLTLGELALWFVRTLRLDVDCRVITMDGWSPGQSPGYGWPLGDRAWVNPSPNAANLWMARCYPGTVMLEGTTLSEGRGTTRPLELFGAPDLDARATRRGDGVACARMAARLPLARMLVRADFSQTRRQAVRGRSNSQRNRALRSHNRVSSMASHGGSPSRPSAPCVRNTRCGATSPTSTSSIVLPSISSTAVRCCGSGWMPLLPCRLIWMRLPGPMNRHGVKSGKTCCFTGERQ